MSKAQVQQRAAQQDDRQEAGTAAHGPSREEIAAGHKNTPWKQLTVVDWT
jgi:hypothetical protein